MATSSSKVSASSLVDSKSLLAKAPPSHLQAERSVLGALLFNDEQFSLLAEIITDEDFYNNAHKMIFRAMHALAQERKRIDILSLQDQLQKNKELEIIGGQVYLLGLLEDIPSLSLLEQHARIVKEKSVLRELIASASSIIASCYEENNLEIEQKLDAAEKKVFEIISRRTTQSFVQIDIWLKKTFQHLSDIKSHSRGITGIPSGFRKLDQMTSGFQKGDLIVLAARPSMGKTALSLCVGQNAASSNFSIGIFSLEMAAEQLILRLLSSLAGVSLQNIRNATISSQEWLELTHVAAQMAESKIFIDDTPMQTVTDIRSKARKLKRDHNIDFLIVDYLQLLYTVKKHENRHQEVSEISRSLKALAKELNIPVLALSQLSRAVESRMDKRPILSDLRESGAIEQDADLIMFLYRDSVYNQETEHPNQAELIIGKQRNGPTGTVLLNYVKELTKFEDLPEYAYKEYS